MTVALEGTYWPGASVVISVPGIVVMLAPDADGELVNECWNAVCGVAPEGEVAVRSGAERLLGILRGRAAEPFGLVAVGARWSRVAGSGDIAIRAGAVGGLPSEAVSCDSRASVDRVLSVSMTDFRLGAVPAPAARTYPLIAGVVLASGISAGRYVDQERADLNPGADDVPARTMDASVGRADAAGRVFFRHGAGAGLRETDSVRPADRTGLWLSLGNREQQSDSGIVQSVGFAALGGGRPSVPKDSVTQRDSVKQSAEADEVASWERRLRAEGELVRGARTEAARVAVEPAPPAVAAAASQPAGGDFGEKDDEEISATVHQTSRPDRTGGGRVGRPLVGAAMCPAGHPNPPEAARCRVCPLQVPAQEETRIERPVLGVLRLSTGPDVPLDRDVLLGREPRSSREAGDKPHEVRLPSPGKDISRNHLEVRLLGWRVVAIDLGSTNGTVVRPPIGPAENLPPGGTRVIEPGTEVSLAGVVSFIYEATA